MSEELDLICEDIHDLRERMVKLESVLKWTFTRLHWMAQEINLPNKIFKEMFKNYYDMREKLSAKDDKKPDSGIMHCFCCGTDITDEKNCFCLKCFNDKIAHDIKKDMVISRELFKDLKEYMGELYEDGYTFAEYLFKELKEVEKQ